MRTAVGHPIAVSHGVQSTLLRVLFFFFFGRKLSFNVNSSLCGYFPWLQLCFGDNPKISSRKTKHFRSRTKCRRCCTQPSLQHPISAEPEHTHIHTKREREKEKMSKVCAIGRSSFPVFILLFLGEEGGIKRREKECGGYVSPAWMWVDYHVCMNPRASLASYTR